MPGTELPQARTRAHGACGSCALFNAANLRKLGVDPGRHDHVVALAGNPNTGKSTVFNALTGLRQHVGNWAGKTVAKAEGGFEYHEHSYKLIDLPGAYSLLSTSDDEDVARDFLLFGSPDVTIVVVDATRLERNLNLVLQILQITGRVVIALNLIDEAERHGITVDERHLARQLGVPVAGMSARTGSGVTELLESVEQVASGAMGTKPRGLGELGAELGNAVDTLARGVREQYPGLPNTRWVALRLLEGDPSIEQAVAEGTLATLGESATARSELPVDTMRNTP